MIILLLVFLVTNLGVATSGIEEAGQDRFSLSVIGEKPFKGDAGYYFSFESIPLSQNQFIFVATPLKRAYFVNGGKLIQVGYTMTVKGRRDFSDYFSGENYNVILTIKEESKIEGGFTLYRGLLEMQYGSEKRRFKVHGHQRP